MPAFVNGKGSRHQVFEQSGNLVSFVEIDDVLSHRFLQQPKTAPDSKL